jgi:pimeloyl-ACP methyl ester carboxylesterase
MSANDTIYAYTGGVRPSADTPVLVFIHGAGHDHSVWQLPARHFARHGYTVLAPDLPGHGRSGGVPLERIDDLANWLVAWLVANGHARVTLVGHSMGSLIALRAAAHHPEQVSRLVLVGSAVPMPVADALLQATVSDRDGAHALINQWSFTHEHQLGASPLPGFHLPGLNRRLMERAAPGVLHTDMAACNGYTEGNEDAALIRCKTTLICGERDLMTPPKAAAVLRGALANADAGARMIVLPGCGHSMMSEAPEAFLNALRESLTST